MEGHAQLGAADRAPARQPTPLNLRDPAEIDRSGLRQLAGWPDLPPLSDVELLLLADADVRQRLDGDGDGLPLRVVEAVDTC